MGKHLVMVILVTILFLNSIEQMLLARKNVSKIDQTASTTFEKKGMIEQLTFSNTDLKAFVRRLFIDQSQRKRKSGFFSIKIGKHKFHDLISEVFGEGRQEIKEPRNNIEDASQLDPYKDTSFQMDLKWFNRMN